ncbi:MAG: proteasome subunit beta [Nitrososphaeria archaeon]
MINNLPVSKTGTTTVGFIVKDAVILATDARVTSGYFVANTVGRKLYKIDDHVAMTIAGTVADAQNVIDILKYHARMYRIERGRPIPVSALARLAANVFFYNRLYPLQVESLIGGYDLEGPSLYMVDLFGSLSKEAVAATGSGSPVALGVLEDSYRENMSVEEGIKLAALAITSAMRRDIATGNDFNIGIIDAKGYRELSKEEKDSLVKLIKI